MKLTVAAALVVCGAALCQRPTERPRPQRQSLILDLSASIAGFADKDSRIPGVLERLGVILRSAGSLDVWELAQTAAGPLRPLTLHQAAGAYQSRASFRGNTPLTRVVEAMAGSPVTSDFLLLTDGMEDDGQLERLSAAMANLAAQGWGASIVALLLPFHGTYYTEQTIPVRAFLPDIEKAVHAANPSWKVVRSSAPCGDSGCYNFDGVRPLFFFVFSRSGDSSRPTAGVVESLKQMNLPPAGVLRLSPAVSPTLRVQVDAPPETKATISMRPGEDLMCAETVLHPMEMSLQIISATASAIPQPSEIRIAGFDILEKPDWVVVPPGPLQLAQGTVATHSMRVICPKGSRWEPVTQFGAFHVRYRPVAEMASHGWWADLSAANTWQYPFRSYKLADLVHAVHQAALAKYRPAPLEYSMRMRVQN